MDNTIPIINFVFSAGTRCTSVLFIQYCGIRTSGPFDSLTIDLHTCFKLIDNDFDDYLNDIVFINKNEEHIELMNKKHTCEIDAKFYELMKNDIGFMSDKHNHHKIFFNQNYIDKNKDHFESDTFFWNTQCKFIHHDLYDAHIIDKLNAKCQRMRKSLKNHLDNTAMFHITSIMSNTNISQFVDNVIELKKEHNINCYLIVLICSDNLDDNEFYDETNKCLFLVKKVDSYENCMINNTSDHLNYDINVIFNKMKKYFDFQPQRIE